MDFHKLDAIEQLERYNFEDSFYDNGHHDPFEDFIISIVEGKYDEWPTTAYTGRYEMSRP